MQKARISIFVIAAIAVVFVGVSFIAKKKPHVPSLPAVGVCKPLRTGLRRLNHSGDLQFDISVQDFSVVEGSTDAPPFLHGFTLTPNGGQSKLNISFGEEESPGTGLNPLQTFSEHWEKRPILNDKGKIVGEDLWGYLERAKTWRRTHFRGGVSAEYDGANRHDANLFDNVISSACLSSSRTD